MNATQNHDDEIVWTLRRAAEVGVPHMRREVGEVLSAGRRAHRRRLVVRSTAGLVGVALVAFGGTALAHVGASAPAVPPAAESGTADANGAEPPALPDGPPDGVFGGTYEEYAAAFASCLRSHGWDVEPGPPDEGAGLDIRNAGPGTDRALQVSQEACRRSVGSKTDPERTDDELRALYDDVVAHYACVREAGFGDQRPPSFESYVTMHRAGNVYADPMVGVADGDYAEALEACPRSGPAD